MPNTTRKQLAYLGNTLEELKQQHRYYHLRVLAGEQKPVATFDGKKVINLSSNNYLGLASHPKLRAAALAAIRKYGVGAGAVRTISGTMRIHMDLERQIAKFKHTEACVVFQSGFTANAGTVAAILGKDDLIISDELNHASIIDGCRLSKAAIRVFKHKDAAECAKICEETKGWPGHKLLITDGVFSMDGDIAPLPALCDLAEKYNCIMMVDDAHSSGVLGRNGRGTVDHTGCHGRVDIQVGTLSKAIGAMGGYVCGSQQLIEFLYHRARPFLFSTSHPPSVTATCQAAFTLLASRAGAELVEKLWENTRYFQKGLTQQGFPPSGSETPISPILVGEAAKAFELTGELFQQGVFAPAVGFPTVPEGKARLRAIVTATHTRKDLEKALDILGRVARKLAIIH
ncbi:MAG TPA: glycine C-acetyltransferase [Candidatus Acidoferrales bacterium]|nr:glycine C-acetyltransferase [Candidatus Acidoferrales bacterium]